MKKIIKQKKESAIPDATSELTKPDGIIEESIPHFSDLICPYCGTDHYLGECQYVKAELRR